MKAITFKRIRPVDDRSKIGAAAFHSVTLAVACLVSYWLITSMLTRVHSISHADDLIGGMWGVISTVFVYRMGHQESVGAASSRMVASLLSFVLCLGYLLIAPFHPVGLAALIAIGTFLLMLARRPGDIVTAGITTTVVMVVAGISPQEAWLQPILRLADTAVGVAVGIGAAWLALQFDSRQPLTLEARGRQ